MSDHQEVDRPTGWHRVNIGHLVMGIAFLGIVGVWGLIQSDTVTGDDIHWLLPIPWVVAGLAGLVATAITGPRRYAVRQTGWVGEPPAREEAPAETGTETGTETRTADLPTYPASAGTDQDPEASA
jgi:hypothetical protein